MKASKFTTANRMLKEILECLNQLSNKKVKNVWFKDTYEICSEINKFLKQKEEE